MIVLALLATTMMAAKAQKEVGTFTLYPRVGVNLSMFTGQKIYTSEEIDEHVEGKYKPGFTGGAELWYQSHQGFAFSAGLLYSNQGNKMEDIVTEYTDDQGNVIHTTLDLSTSTQMLTVPLLAHAFIAQGLSIEAGIQGGFLLGARNKSRSDSWNVKPLMKTFDLSIPVGISYEYQNVQLDLRYVHGLTSLGDFFEKGHNRSFVLTVGYGFDF